jgi:hypothetical protein
MAYTYQNKPLTLHVVVAHGLGIVQVFKLSMIYDKETK